MCSMYNLSHYDKFLKWTILWYIIHIAEFYFIELDAVLYYLFFYV